MERYCVERVDRVNREELIELCERAIVDENKWRNRDSHYSQLNIGKAWALLKAGCDFTVDDEKFRSHWIRIYSKGFSYFDWTGKKEDESFYIPTEERLDEADGDVWYQVR